MRLLYTSLFLLSCSTSGWTDSIARYMSVSDNVARMEMKADSNSQAWARSARNILLLTSESIWESLEAMNKISSEKGQALFCLGQNEPISAEKMTEIIQDTYAKLNLDESQKTKMTVAQVALMGIQQRYPCAQQQAQQPMIQVHQRGPSLAQRLLHATGH